MEQQQLLRVLSVRDSKEWLVPLRAGEQHVQVATLKRLVLEQQRLTTVTRDHGDERKSEDIGDDDEEEKACERDNTDASDSFVMFRGRILADMDFFNLHTLTASDFFVFAQDPPDDSDDSRSAPHEPHATASDDAHHEQSDHVRNSNSRKRKRTDTALSAQQEQLAQQLVAMGFELAQARRAMQQSGVDLTTAIGILTGDATVASGSQHSAVGQTHVLICAHPQLRAIESALPELIDLDLHGVAARDVFAAIMHMKELVPSETLAPLVAHPSAAVHFFRLPPAVVGRSRSMRVEIASGLSEDAAIDLADDSPTAADIDTEPVDPSELVASHAEAARDLDIIERLASMGFDRDLVVAMYESCGKQEEVALNALCELLQ